MSTRQPLTLRADHWPGAPPLSLAWISSLTSFLSSGSVYLSSLEGILVAGVRYRAFRNTAEVGASTPDSEGEAVLTSLEIRYMYQQVIFYLPSAYVPQISPQISTDVSYLRKMPQQPPLSSQHHHFTKNPLHSTCVVPALSETLLEARRRDVNDLFRHRGTCALLVFVSIDARCEAAMRLVRATDERAEM